MVKNYSVRFLGLVVLVLLGSICFSCLKNDDDPVVSRTPGDEEKELLAYLKENAIEESAKTDSGLYFISVEEGEGELPAQGAEVKVRYQGCFLDGRLFDKGEYSFVLGKNQVIRGWEEGIAMMKPGGKAQLIIPSSLAYGPRGYAVIPPYTALVFDVELLEVK